MSARSGLPVESYQLLIANIATKPASLLFAGQFLRPRSPHRAAGQSYHNKPISYSAIFSNSTSNGLDAHSKIEDNEQIHQRETHIDFMLYIL